MKRGRKKKAISPLIATVILVGFAVALGALVSSYVINQAQSFNPEGFLEDSPFCDNVVIEIQTDPQHRPCKCIPVGSGGRPERFIHNLDLKNKGSFAVQSMQIDAPGQSGQIQIYQEPAGCPGINPPCCPENEADTRCALPAGTSYENMAISFLPNVLVSGSDTLVKIKPVVRDLQKTIEGRQDGSLAGDEEILVICPRQEIQFDLTKVAPGGNLPNCDSLYVDVNPNPFPGNACP